MGAEDVAVMVHALEPDLDRIELSLDAVRQHPAMASQQLKAHRRHELLTRSGACGDRATGTLHLVLEQHAPQRTFDEFDRAHLTCRECRPGGRDPSEQYPCPTALRVMWALEAALH